ncbi:MAG: 4Fe-4S binding protein [Thermoplasmata archaeon]|nr:4Fe-4S binding protein [Thermoplasmata archaeon]
MEGDVTKVSDNGKRVILEQRQKLEEGKRGPSTVIPVNMVIPARQRILTDAQVREILTTSDSVGITQCGCRVSEGNCTSPLDVCIVVGMSDEDIAKDEDTEPFSVEEALEVLDRTSDLGLVHITLWDGSHTPYAICSCCPCCCHELLAMSRFGYSDQVIVSDFIAEHDEDACEGCGTCVGRCHFGAFTDIDDGVDFDKEACFGCGLCALTCPSDAISMVERG